MGRIGFGEHPSNIFERLLEGGAFPKFIQLIEASGLKEELITGGPFTVLVPSDEAIDFSPPEKLEEFDKSLKDPVLARKVLHRHMIGDIYKIHELVNKEKIKALNGEELSIKAKCKIKEENNLEMDFESGKVEVFINDAKVELANIPCSNGMLHIINKLL